ncbi:MAG: dienelactone hydrolase family protein [Planctomycetaceae bacterium]
MLRVILGLLTFSLSASYLHAEVKSKTIPYKHGDLEFEGYLAWDDAVSGKRPGVLVVHEWWGLNDYARRRADQLAKLGYVAFALDMYGKGVLVSHPNEAGQMAGKVRANVKDWRDRALAGLNVLKSQEQCDSTRLAAMGYCFGGSTVLQLAYTGADVKGVVTFHGALTPPTEEETKQIKAKILVCHGADDSFIPEETIDKFRHALNQGKADWTMVYYSGARHSFTDPDADSHGVDGLKYNKRADERSWHHMRDFFGEVLAKH